jgi:hypothetical protein
MSPVAVTLSLLPGITAFITTPTYLFMLYQTKLEPSSRCTPSLTRNPESRLRCAAPNSCACKFSPVLFSPYVAPKAVIHVLLFRRNNQRGSPARAQNSVNSSLNLAPARSERPLHYPTDSRNCASAVLCSEFRLPPCARLFDYELPLWLHQLKVLAVPESPPCLISCAIPNLSFMWSAGQCIVEVISSRAPTVDHPLHPLLCSPT